MWPKFDATEKKVEKPALQLYLEPLAGFENVESPVRRKNNNSKIIILIKILVVLLCVILFSVSLYFLILHMIHCADMNNSTSDDLDQPHFFEKYVAGEGNRAEIEDSSYPKINIEIYDGEYDVPANIEDYRQRYKEFLKKYGKTYSPAEEEYRLRVYVHNVIEYEEEERKSPGMDYDDTPFTDMTDKELKAMLSSYEDMPSMEGVSRFEEKIFKEAARPPSMDWRFQRKVTQIKNQQQCGSCWAFAVVASVESQHAIKKNTTGTAVLSEQQLLDCDSRNNGCHGGYRPYAMAYIMKNGLYPEALYPYLATEHNNCKTKVFINDYKTLSTNEETQADWVAQNGPVTFGMKVTKSMYNYRSGIFEPSKEDCEQHSLGSHAMTFIGYGTENGKDFWIVKNSWGPYWGMAGYFKLARGVNACGAAETVVAPIIN